jgi:hypothetical protein
MALTHILLRQNGMNQVHRAIHAITYLLLAIEAGIRQTHYTAALENRAKDIYLSSWVDRAAHESDLYAQHPALFWLVYLLVTVIFMTLGSSIVGWIFVLGMLYYFASLLALTTDLA